MMSSTWYREAKKRLESRYLVLKHIEQLSIFLYNSFICGINAVHIIDNGKSRSYENQ